MRMRRTRRRNRKKSLSTTQSLKPVRIDVRRRCKPLPLVRGELAVKRKDRNADTVKSRGVNSSSMMGYAMRLKE